MLQHGGLTMMQARLTGVQGNFHTYILQMLPDEVAVSVT